MKRTYIIKLKKKNVLKYISRTLFLVIFLSLGKSVQAQFKEPQGQILEKIVAKVDNEIILQSEIEVAYLQFKQRNNSFFTPNLKCKVLETLVVNKLLLAKAVLDSVSVDEDQVQHQLDSRMQMLLQQFNGNEESLLKEYGKSMNQLKKEYHDDVRDQLLIQTMQNKISKDVEITPNEVVEFFNEIPQDSLPFFPMELEIAHIVKLPVPNPNQESLAKSKAEFILAKIRAGADFEMMAKRYSEGPSGKNGGNLGFAKRGAMVTEFEETALRLKEGEVSEVTKTKFGYHIIQMIERRGNEYNSRHILIQPTSSNSDLNYAKEFVDSIRTIIVNKKLSFSMAAHRYSDDEATKGSGGFFKDQTGNTRVVAEPDKIDPDLYFLVTSMNVGEISEPLEFTTRSGEKAYRIVWLKNKIQPHQANLKYDYQKIQAAALEAKKSTAVSKWFHDTKEEIYIDIDEDYSHCTILED